jgi:ZIP family zinc transporter
LSSGQILLLGAIAGLTIFIGLPVARLRNPSVAGRAFLTAMATGILVFLFVDVMEHGIAPVEKAAETHDWRTSPPTARSCSAASASASWG